MNDTRNWMRSAACALMVVGSLAAHGQQPFPSKTIRIVSSQAGGINDFTARLVAEELERSMGVSVVVDNRGGGVVAGSIVAKAPPDGHTLLHYGTTFWLLPLMRAHVPYDPIRDFVPIAASVSSINVLVVHPSLPVRSVKELIAFAKTRPGQIDYSSAAEGTSNHLAAELFKARAGVDFRRIPFRGSASALTAVVTGEVQVCFPTYATAVPYMKSGRARILAVTTPKPTLIAPGLPTVASTVPGYHSSGKFGFFAPAGTPAAIIGRLNREIVAALNKPAVRERLKRVGSEVDASTPEEFAASIQSDIQTIGKIIKQMGLGNR